MRRGRPFRNFLLCLLIQLSRWHVFAQQLLAPAWPIAVKNPYLNSYYSYGRHPVPLNMGVVSSWFDTGTPTRWFCGILVDGVGYRLMSNDALPILNTSTQQSVSITPTQTILQMQAGPVNVTMNFLSPVTGTDLIRQSLPFTYLSITIAPTDGASHSVRVYSDFSLEWITRIDNVIANPVQDIDSDFVIYEPSLYFPQPFSEVSQRPQDGSVVFAVRNNAGVDYEVGNGTDVTSRGLNSTGLRDTIDSDASQLGISAEDTWAISLDMGNITTSSQALYTIGVIRDPSIQFIQLSDDVQTRNSYYRMHLSTARDMVSFLLDDFDNAVNTASLLDNRISSDAAKISPDYGTLLALITRQAMGAIEITVSKNTDDNFNSSDIMAFLKDMGSVGLGFVNAVDVLYAAFPIYIYLNPAIGGYLLKPLLVAQDSPLYSQPYAAQGLGSKYPNATIEDLPHNFGIEQSGNMIIMILAHLQASGDPSLIKQHYGLIRGWADYLVDSSMNPGSQQSAPSDGVMTFNQTNLALKGVIGIGAMAKISNFLGMNSDASKYNDTSKSYMEQWTNLTISQDNTHLLTSFGSESSAGLIYNLYADKLLQLNLVPQSVFDLQTAYCKSQNVSSKFGVPLDNRNLTSTRADWILFTAAASNDTDLRSSLISSVYSYAFAPGSSSAISPLYDPTSGNANGTGVNSPSMGALFSVLALDIPLQLDIPPTPAKTKGDSKSKATAVGAAVGGAVGLTIFCTGIFIFKRSQRDRRRRETTVVLSPFAPIHRDQSETQLLSNSKFLSLRFPRSPSALTSQATVGEDRDRESLNDNQTLRQPIHRAGNIDPGFPAPPSYTTEEPHD